MHRFTITRNRHNKFACFIYIRHWHFLWFVLWDSKDFTPSKEPIEYD